MSGAAVVPLSVGVERVQFDAPSRVRRHAWAPCVFGWRKGDGLVDGGLVVARRVFVLLLQGACPWTNFIFL